MRYMHRKVTVLIALLALAACGSAKDANQDNFSQAIQDYLASQTGFCAGIPANHYPFTLATEEVFVESNKRRADAFVSAGLLNSSDTQIKSRFSQAQTPALEYSLSSLGQKHLVKAGAGGLGNHDAFCTGDYIVQDIESFTEPADAMGLKISRVAYTYKLKDAHKWLHNEAVQREFPESVEQIDTLIEGRAVLVLTNKGWVHERLLKP